MAAFTATDWAVTINDVWIEGKKRHVAAKLTATVGSTNSSAGVVPLPSKGPFGMVQRLDYLIITDGNLVTDGTRAVDYRQADNTLAIFSTTASGSAPRNPLPSATAVTGTIYIQAVGF
jgi:hypothetical protein